MKSNVQIRNAAEIARVVADSLSADIGEKVVFKSDSCYIERNGDFHFVMRDEKTKTFSHQETFTANEIAYMVNMPLWEVVSIGVDGFDELAIMFYEEN